MMSTLTPLPPWAQQLIRWGFPAELPLHIQSPGGREGGVDWALVSVSQGEHGLGLDQDPGGEPWESEAWVHVGRGWAGWGGSGPVAPSLAAALLLLLLA